MHMHVDMHMPGHQHKPRCQTAVISSLEGIMHGITPSCVDRLCMQCSARTPNSGYENALKCTGIACRPLLTKSKVDCLQGGRRPSSCKPILGAASQPAPDIMHEQVQGTAASKPNNEKASA